VTQRNAKNVCPSEVAVSAGDRHGGANEEKKERTAIDAGKFIGVSRAGQP